MKTMSTYLKVVDPFNHVSKKDFLKSSNKYESESDNASSGNRFYTTRENSELESEQSQLT